MKQSRTVTILVRERTLAQHLAAIAEPAGFHVTIAMRGHQHFGAAPARATTAVETKPNEVSHGSSVPLDHDVDGTPLERPYGIGHIGRLAALH